MLLVDCGCAFAFVLLSSLCCVWFVFSSVLLLLCHVRFCVYCCVVMICVYVMSPCVVLVCLFCLVGFVACC